MVATRHSALKNVSQIFREKYHQYVVNDIYFKKVFTEKPIIIAFSKKKSIRNYIVRMDINEVNEQKKPKTTPCS